MSDNAWEPSGGWPEHCIVKATTLRRSVGTITASSKGDTQRSLFNNFFLHNTNGSFIPLFTNMGPLVLGGGIPPS